MVRPPFDVRMKETKTPKVSPQATIRQTTPEPRPTAVRFPPAVTLQLILETHG